MVMLKVENLSKKFKDLEVLKDISLEVNQGEVVAIIGPSGSGTVSYTHLDVYKRQQGNITLHWLWEILQTENLF